MKNQGGWWLSWCYPRHSNQQPFCFIVNAGQLFVCFVFSSFKMFSARPSCFLTSVSETQSEAARMHLSVMSRARVQTKRERKKGFLKDFFKKWGIVWWGRNTFLLQEERIFPFVGFLRRWETQRWVHIIALSDKETYYTCVSEAVEDYGGEVIKCV